jgi:hypothetical protein
MILFLFAIRGTTKNDDARKTRNIEQSAYEFESGARAIS